ncbi:hypothetical protein GCM10010517_63190 [Streptosporangium fragile]|uniref:HTH lacI-type domain-containing protein n=1 Tax=Streptosporangium fragile TaxID=46186 RepID=A0ABN3W7H8_9ACTN
MTTADTPPLPKLAVIAREAGVSVATVSKALNGRSDVSPHTRRLITEVLERRGYPRRPRRRRRGDMIDVVLQGLASPYALAVLGGVGDGAWRAGVDLVVSAVVDRTRNGQPPPAWLDRISVRDSAGVLLVRTSPTAAHSAIRQAGHTACRLCARAGRAGVPDNGEMRIRDLRNLGPKSELWLDQVGIGDAGRLAELGAVEAYRRLQDAAIPGLSLNALWALEGALTENDWRLIPAERKQELLAELAEG